MRSFPLTVLQGGINRLRVKGGASANQLYDLQNAWITNAGSIVPREGTIRTATLDSSTVGLAAANGEFNIFSSAFSTAALPANYVLNVLSDPNDRSQPPTKIWFAKPFMGFEYVVAQFANGDVFHYWLQNNGTWTSSTDYTSASIVLPPVLNGLAYQGVRDFPPNPLWTPETIVSIGTIVEPTTPTGFAYQAVDTSPATDNTAGLLLHCDGTSGSTSFPDSSGNSLVVTPVGLTAVSSVQVKFGTGSAHFPYLPSIGNVGLTVPVASGGPIDLTAGDFTIEGWFYLNSLNNGVGTFQCLFDNGVTSTDGLRIYVDTTGLLATQFFATGGTIGTINVAGVVAAVWNNFTLVRQGTTYTLYLNGSTGISGSITSAFALNVGATIFLGQSQNSAATGTFVDGYMDEIRVSKLARYTANFTPAGPFAGSSEITQAAPHTGSTEPIWPTVAGGVLQEFGDFDVSTSDAGTTQASLNGISTASPLGSNITDRYGDSTTISNGGIFTATSTLSTFTLASTKVTTWQPGTNYAPGAVVIPTTNQGAFINAIPNGDFEGGSAAGGWTFTDPGATTQWDFSNVLPYQGTECIGVPGGAGIGGQGAFATMTSYGLITPGQSVTASAYLDPNNAGANLTLWIQLNWYDATDSIISSSGHAQNEQEGGGYRKTSITATAPTGAAHVRVSIGAGSGTNSRNTGFADLVTWDLETAAPVTNFLFEAVQPSAASSAANEPIWPTVLGNEVIDGGVTWKAIGTSIITWQAIPLMQSGLNAPTFPTVIGNSVSDSSTFINLTGDVINTTMSWEAVDRHIADPKDPNTVAVAIGASHVFAGDNDIVDYSAAVDPTDWTSSNNAGYLPTGLNNYGDNPVKALALYRGNLIVFNAGGYQMWQIDPDPQNMAFLDAQPVGSISPRAAQSVANDLLFLTEVGVRNLSTIGATANMAVGNTGQPVDPLVQAQIQAATYDPFSIYYPGRGQFWLIYGPQVFVLTINGNNLKTWSRYIFPQVITDATLNEGFLYLRTVNNLVWQLNTAAIGIDDSNSVLTTQGASVPFNGVVQWPYLDLSSLGVNKMLVGLDIVGEGSCIMQVAFNQNDKTTFNDNPGFSASTGVTTPYLVQIDDTTPGEPLALPINAASYSPILTFTGSSTSANAWTWQAMNIYFSPAPSNAAGAAG